jgi:hypothetical protein
MNEIMIPVSPGELLDKITILVIKSRRIKDPLKLANVRLELTALQAIWDGSPYAGADVAADIEALTSVNERLWVIEDDIRDQERAKSFEADFIRLARAVYIENDTRAAIKRRINVRLGSTLVEEKSYNPY